MSQAHFAYPGSGPCHHLLGKGQLRPPDGSARHVAAAPETREPACAVQVLRGGHPLGRAVRDRPAPAPGKGHVRRHGVPVENDGRVPHRQEGPRGAAVGRAPHRRAVLAQAGRRPVPAAAPSAGPPAAHAEGRGLLGRLRLQRPGRPGRNRPPLHRGQHLGGGGLPALRPRRRPGDVAGPRPPDRPRGGEGALQEDHRGGRVLRLLPVAARLRSQRRLRDHAGQRRGALRHGREVLHRGLAPQ
mmetsp:Transcript_56608/g.165537  ORF Transcript_56608/g.165537 Transcript_56608/m.165537 type:complete len:243 (+) Transcript_56608:935-1663(+)